LSSIREENIKKKQPPNAAISNSYYRAGQPLESYPKLALKALIGTAIACNLARETVNELASQGDSWSRSVTLPRAAPAGTSIRPFEPRTGPDFIGN
jgi:hypothetical protein